MSARAMRPVRRQAGLTLVELMVSLTLGLLIVAATAAGYLGLSDAGRIADAQARMDEDGQAALSILAAQLRMAGNNPDRPYRIPATRRNPVYAGPSPYAVRGCDGTFANIATAATVQDLTCAGGPATAPDSIAITYEADRFNTIAAAPGAVPTDCLGHALATTAATLTVVTPPGPATADEVVTFHVADNRFYVDAAAPGASPSLYCKGNGAGSVATPLVENVEDLQLTYGTLPATAPPGPTSIAGYLDATGVSGHPALAVLADESARWERVAAVQVCVVVRSRRAVGSDGSARYLGCAGNLETPAPDGLLRRAYRTTVVLRNR